MSRSVLWVITGFLSLAMIALVAVQAYWMKHSITSEAQHLKLVVNQVLSEVSNELIQNETTLNILDELRPPVIQQRSSAFWNFRIDARSSYSSRPGEGIDYEEEVIAYTSPDQSLKNQRVQLIDDSVLVVVGHDETIRDTILINAMQPEQVRNELDRRWTEQEQLVEKVVKNMLEEERDIRDRFSGDQIEQMVREKLQEKGVVIPFEYAVYEVGKPPIFFSDQYNQNETNYFRGTLFPGGIFRQRTLINVYFPDVRKHLIRSTGVMGISSLLITLFIFTMFSLALYVIFKQKKLSEMKNDFVNNMTHELKTPISTISLASQMLNDRSIPDAQKNLNQISRIIRTESKQLSFQVERVLQMAIFDHGQLRLKTEEVDIHDLVETVAQNFLLQMEKREGTLEFLPEAEESVVRGDKMHLTNVISNLLENAMKYTRQTPRIGIITRNEGTDLVLSVSDNGIGIGKEDQKRIFDKFYRVPTGNLHNVKGFGLGLSYVKLIVEHHGGQIRLKSELQKGTTFHIHLPLYKEPIRKGT